MSKNELLTAAQVAAMHHVTERTVRYWIAGGKLPAVRLGATYGVKRIHAESFEKPVLTGWAAYHAHKKEQTR